MHGQAWKIATELPIQEYRLHQSRVLLSEVLAACGWGAWTEGTNGDNDIKNRAM